MLISACSQQNTTQNDMPDVTVEPGLPVMWINYQGDKYTLDEVYSDGEIGLEDLISTSTFTGKGDGTQFGEEIFVERESGDLFIFDDSGPNEEWVRFVKQ